MTFYNIGKFKLQYLKSNYDNLARQGSQAWLQGRLTRFGGSEIGQVVKSLKSSNKLVEAKISKKYISNLYCWWGHLFEVIAKHYLKVEKKIEIHEFGAIPSSDYPVAYSPDGVFIKENDLWLLEIKCPFLRDVHERATIKEDYKFQVQMGMQILPCNKTAFMQFKFRRCSHYDLKINGAYDRNFHNELKRSPKQSELWHGAVYWKNSHMVTYGFDQENEPTEIFYSFETNVYERCEKLTTGIIMYFKCFYILNQVVHKDAQFENKYSDIIWARYQNLITAYKNACETTKKLS